MPTKIEWANETWNPTTGCDGKPISPGCDNCYARRMSQWLAGRYGYPDAPDNFKVTTHPDRLFKPGKWYNPRLIFVGSMGDLFHSDVPYQFLREVFAVMWRLQRHTFMLLTKRPQRMARFLRWLDYSRAISGLPTGLTPNIWLGVSAENQMWFDCRVTELLKIPAARHFVSVEPMLGAVDLHLLRNKPCLHPECYSHVTHPCERCGYQAGKLLVDCIICGAETGPRKRKMDLDWARSLRDQCQIAGVPFFFKRDSEGRDTLDGALWQELPERIG